MLFGLTFRIHQSTSWSCFQSSFLSSSFKQLPPWPYLTVIFPVPESWAIYVVTSVNILCIIQALNPKATSSRKPLQPPTEIKLLLLLVSTALLRLVNPESYFLQPLRFKHITYMTTFLPSLDTLSIMRH